MSNKGYRQFYRQLTQKILNKVVSPQVLGTTSELEQQYSASSDTPICYVLQDASLSNTVLIDNEAQKRHLPSVYQPLKIGTVQEEDSILVLNEKNHLKQGLHYPAKLIHLIEVLDKNPKLDVDLVPVTMLWGRAPEYEDSWYKALFADAWSTPSPLKQAMNISLYGRENYLEFHKPLSLRKLLTEAKEVSPNFSPAHHIMKELNTNFNKYKEAILGPDLSDRRNVINNLLISDSVKHAIRKESIDENISLFEAENRARHYLTEIASDFSYSTLRFGYLALTKLWTQLYDGIEVHNFDTVRELAQDYEIVYTPCHRSHIDYLLLSYVIFNRGLMVPHIAAGINLNLPIVGQLFRGAGAYFIRRSFNGNELYTSVFKEYLHSLLMRNTPLEYFIEGGRSRTGLLLPAKKGMLSMTIQSHLRGNSKPIVFIPTYFGYEKLLEGTSYLNELSGKPKEAESLWGILSSARKIEKVFGQVYVNFGEPVFLNDVLKQQDAENIKLKINDKLPASVVNTVDQTAQSILENINKAVVINPISIISLILLNAPEHQLTESSLVATLDQYRKLLEQNRYDDRMIISGLSSADIIQYAVKLKQVEIHHQNSETWVRVADSQKILLSYFSNNILHCFILASLVARIIQHHEKIEISELIQLAQSLYPFIQEEFFLKWQLEDVEIQIHAILDHFEDAEWIERDASHVMQSSTESTGLQTLAALSERSLNNFIVMQSLI
ncbi:MAG: glycerol-3-phosphate 1-O-acyltransferase PlsB, partial [Acinetobacter tandoii]|uniref:glycerol-3-phosphate 1-O-acyltransferase PlsB n=1 Tax=Acinetobacter tandoii TaxID=202954 RepID=UPI003D6C1B07